MWGQRIGEIVGVGFSALQRAEIAEMGVILVLVNSNVGFSALQRAEIAEIPTVTRCRCNCGVFQCSSTSRNC